ncbi:MAG: GNAT family N-acetyltransferase [Candidatus Dormibacteraceae bacterium]
MDGDLMVSPVDFHTAGPELWKRYHDYRRARQKDERPDDPVRPDQVEEQRLRLVNMLEFEYRYEIQRSGVTLSMFGGSTVRSDNPEYATNKHLLWVDFYVRRAERRRRIGAAWLPVVLELMDRHGCTTVNLSAEDKAGHAFLKWAGAEARMTGAENRLDVADVDWAMVERWVEEGPRRSPGTRLEIYDAGLPEAMWPDFAPQISILLNTIPWEGLDHGEIVVTPAHMKRDYEQIQASQETLHSVLTREPDGSMSSITEVTWAPYSSTIVRQQFTGVLPGARGRGLGKWIKAAMLLRLRELHPDFRWLSTGNAGSNAPMLAINKKLGFKQYRAGADYQMTRDQLAIKIRSV